MPQFTIDCRDEDDLKRLWQNTFATGTFFLSTQKPFALQTEFDLLLRIARKGSGILLQARVIQILTGKDPSSRGMVAMFDDFEAMKSLLDQALDNLRRAAQPNVIE